MDIGYEIVEWLIDIGVLITGTTAKKVPYVEIKKELTFDLIASASFFKPFISTQGFPEIYKTTTENGGFKLNFGVDNNKIPNEKYTIIKVPPNNKKILQLLENYSNMPHTCSNEEFIEFITYLQEVCSAPLKSDTMFDFCKSVYHLDLRTILENNSNKELVEKIMEFGRQFTKNYLKTDDLYQQTSTNLACRYALNQIYSYKIFLFGLLNDLNLYRHFNYFFISKYLTSTGRINSRHHFLQFQGNKLSLGFLTFLKQKKLHAEDVQKVNAIIKKVCPEISQKYFIKNGEHFLTLTRGLFERYVKSFCKVDSDLSTYPHDSAYVSDKMKWLVEHCKKAKEIFQLKLYSYNLILS